MWQKSKYVGLNITVGGLKSSSGSEGLPWQWVSFLINLAGNKNKHISAHFIKPVSNHALSAIVLKQDPSCLCSQHAPSFNIQYNSTPRWTGAETHLETNKAWGIYIIISVQPVFKREEERIDAGTQRCKEPNYRPWDALPWTDIHTTFKALEKGNMFVKWLHLFLLWK